MPDGLTMTTRSNGPTARRSPYGGEIIPLTPRDAETLARMPIKNLESLERAAAHGPTPSTMARWVATVDIGGNRHLLVDYSDWLLRS